MRSHSMGTQRILDLVSTTRSARRVDEALVVRRAQYVVVALRRVAALDDAQRDGHREDFGLGQHGALLVRLHPHFS